jgi:Family of unknown function (DUF6088)
MTESIEIQILYKIKKAKRGSLFFVESFATIANAKAVNKALERLVLSNELHRIATGIYVRPQIDKTIGIVYPSIDNIAIAIAKRDKAKIVPTGSYALYKLGLTTQVPLNIVYYTNASTRKIKIGKQTITFKKASAKNVSAIGSISMLAIQALKSIGKDKATDAEIKKIQQLLTKEKSYHLQHDIRLAPEWIRKTIGAIKTVNA